MTSEKLTFTGKDIHTSIPTRFRKVVDHLPGHLAIVSPGEQISYVELGRLSDQIAAEVVKKGLQQESLVAIFIEQSVLAIAALLGVLKIGSGYLLLSPDTPRERLRKYWEDAGRPILLTNKRNLAGARQLAQPDEMINLEDLRSQDTFESVPNPPTSPKGMAAVFYTSGSVGELKGVIWTHEMILHTAYLNLHGYGIVPEDRLAVLASYGYGASMTQSFAALLNGATLYFPETPHHDLRALGDWIVDNEISILGMPPLALLRQILSLLKVHRPLQFLRMAILGGEDLYREDIELFRDILPPTAILAYRLAGSETMVMCENIIDYKAELPDGKIPVGFPIQDSKLILVGNEVGQLQDSDVGEIVIISRYLSPGYWQKPELTERKFFQDPDQPDLRIYHTGDLGRFNEQGQLIYVGRQDNTVRIHGFGVQLEEIEQLIEKLPMIKQAVVNLSLDPSGKRLVAYLVPQDGNPDPKLNLRDVLGSKLPRYMIPSQLVWLDSIPRTPTGKVNRHRLPAPDMKRPELKTPYQAPKTDLESQLVSIWKSLLDLDSVGVDDNFFDLGGDSLLILELSLEVERLYEFSLPQSFFQEPTIAKLKELITAKPDFKGGYEQFTISSPHEFQGSDWEGSDKKEALTETIRKAFSPDLAQKVRRALRKGRDRIVGKRFASRDYNEAQEWAVKLSKSGLSQCLFSLNQEDLFLRWLNVVSPEKQHSRELFQLNILNNIYCSIPKVVRKEEKHRTDILQKYLESSSSYYRSLGELFKYGDVDQITEQIPMLGLQYLQQAYQIGKGVILVSYHGTPRVGGMIPLEKVLGLDSIPTISYLIPIRQSGYQQQREQMTETALSALSAEIALYGQNRLQEGKIVFFASDTGQTPGDAYPLTIAQRQYWIKPGFAEMALNTGAVVIPLARYCLPDGRMQMEFFPALESGDGDHQRQIRKLLTGYAKFIETRLAVHPEAINWRRMNHHLGRPVSQS